jgi:alpha-L-fucosidase 2
MMALDYYEYTGDETFAIQTMLPIAKAGMTFFDKHFTRDANGKLLLDPDNAIEQYWKVHNPAPDIAGLRAVLARLIALPNSLVDDATRTAWSFFLSEIPVLPIGTRNNKTVLLPYTGPQTANGRNGENPELYAIFPFRLYGIDKPDLEMAINTFNERIMKMSGCWHQDLVQSAMLGLANVAKDNVTINFTQKDFRQKFPAFWTAANDYAPDQDNGGMGEVGLQHMIMYNDGKKINLLPGPKVGTVISS